MRKKRVLPPEAPIRTEAEALTEFLSPHVPEPPEPPPEEPTAGSPTMDGYLRGQVMREMYGTDQPTEYERKLQALRNML